MLICVIYKFTKGGKYVSDTRCLNAHLLTQFDFMFYVTDKIMLYVKWVEYIHFEFEFEFEFV